MPRTLPDMDVGSKLAELELTEEEVARLSRAFKDERFRKLLREYADEIAHPENRQRYEEEIRQLERERGVDATFVHPTPHKVLKTSVDGRQKCFVNVCTNELIGRPESAPGRGSAGQPGQHWSLPYSLSPGRQHMDSKGHTYVVYDVIFHPETLRIAGKNQRFMELVDSTALQGVQSQFRVQLDENNVKVLKIKYKGVPNPSVIRKPLPGQSARGKEADPSDPLAFPYPYDNGATKADGPKETNGLVQQSDPGAPTKPTVPLYTIKYRSYVDLQDYTYARDSAPGPRPKELVVIIDLPLLKSTRDTDLTVTERRLLLRSHKPAYRLELLLPYPVDENKGEAKFNKTKAQLTVTLPVVPLQKPLVEEAEAQKLVSIAGGQQGGDTDEGEEARQEDERWSQADAMESSSEDNYRLLDSAPTPILVDNSTSDPLREQVSIIKYGVNDGYGEAKDENPVSVKGSKPDNQANASTPTDAQCEPALRDAEQSNMIVCCEENSDIKEQFSTTHMALGVGAKPSSGISSIPDVLKAQLRPLDGGAHEGDPHAQPSGDDGLTEDGEEEEVRLQLDEDTGMEKRDGPSADQDVEEQEGGEPKLGNELDEDDLRGKESHQSPEKDLTPVILTEINPQDGREEVIKDHTTSSGLSFENSLLYELD